MQRSFRNSTRRLDLGSLPLAGRPRQTATTYLRIFLAGCMLLAGGCHRPNYPAPPPSLDVARAHVLVRYLHQPPDTVALTSSDSTLHALPPYWVGLFPSDYVKCLCVRFAVSDSAAFPTSRSRIYSLRVNDSDTYDTLAFTLLDLTYTAH